MPTEAEILVVSFLAIAFLVVIFGGRGLVRIVRGK